MTRLSADLDLCEGYGNCVFEADDYFEVDDEGVVEIRHVDVAEADLARVRLAVASCPVAALILSEEA